MVMSVDSKVKYIRESLNQEVEFAANVRKPTAWTSISHVEKDTKKTKPHALIVSYNLDSIKDREENSYGRVSQDNQRIRCVAW